MVSISVLIPVFNEEGSLSVLYDELIRALKKTKLQYEVVFVDDGSTDRSFEILKDISLNDDHVSVIKFRRNFGKSAALSAGFSHSKGDIVIAMDADLQNDPADIPLFLEKIGQGYDLVNGWRHSRHDPLFSKIFPSAVSNIFVRNLIGLRIHDYVCAFKAYTRDAAKSLKLYGEMHRYIPALLFMNGFKISEVKVNHRARRFGRSKYNFTRIMKGLLDVLYIRFWMSYNTRPLHFFGLLGFFQFFIAFIILVEQVFKAFMVRALNLGPLLLLSVLLVITGTLFILVGFLGEIMIRTYYASTGEPYVIERIVRK
ncbi:glycosyltransferase family 2 protein [Candidatus Woesearchaeota archaeon]|nr:glycosyltransferase family 2 protein [Candidatus Woesearchaeota archaeon]